MYTNYCFSCTNENLARLKKAFKLNFLCLMVLNKLFIRRKKVLGGKEASHCFCGVNRILILLIAFGGC